MSHVLLFDTLMYTKKLKAAGVSEKHAEAHAEALKDVISDTLATKRDLKDLANTLRTEMKHLELRIIVKQSGIFSAILGIVLILSKVLHI